MATTTNPKRTQDDIAKMVISTDPSSNWFVLVMYKDGKQIEFSIDRGQEDFNIFKELDRFMQFQLGADYTKTSKDFE